MTSFLQYLETHGRVWKHPFAKVFMFWQSDRLPEPKSWRNLRAHLRAMRAERTVIAGAEIFWVESQRFLRAEANGGVSPKARARDIDPDLKMQRHTQLLEIELRYERDRDAGRCI